MQKVSYKSVFCDEKGKIFKSTDPDKFFHQGLVSENAWLQEQLEGAQRILADCQGAAYPLEILWVLITMVLFDLVMGVGRLWWLKTHPRETFIWDV